MWEVLADVDVRRVPGLDNYNHYTRKWPGRRLDGHEGRHAEGCYLYTVP
jgi:hypothetical protein